MAFKTKQQKEQLKEKPKERKSAKGLGTCRAQMSPIPETEPAHQTEDQTVMPANKKIPSAVCSSDSFRLFSNTDLKFTLFHPHTVLLASYDQTLGKVCSYINIWPLTASDFILLLNLCHRCNILLFMWRIWLLNLYNEKHGAEMLRWSRLFSPCVLPNNLTITSKLS